MLYYFACIFRKRCIAPRKLLNHSELKLGTLLFYYHNTSIPSLLSFCLISNIFWNTPFIKEQQSKLDIKPSSFKTLNDTNRQNAKKHERLDKKGLQGVRDNAKNLLLRYGSISITETPKRKIRQNLTFDQPNMYIQPDMGGPYT